MRRALAQLVCPLGLLALWAGPAFAQAPEKADPGTAPVLQTAVAVICSIIVMVIVCMPSRKG